MYAATGIRHDLDISDVPAYYLSGFDIEVSTPIFVMSRLIGWTAHIIEQGESTALIRPLNEYLGVP